MWANVFVFLWPLLFFADFYVWGEDSKRIGNDFHGLYYVYKAYLLDFLTRGDFPLWSPGEAAGFPFYSNPFAQAFYPLNAALALYAWLMGGYSVWDHQLYTILGVSIFALGTFRWLRCLGMTLAAALFASCIASVSLKFGDILRFPNAVHAAAWLPWLLLAMTRAFLGQSGGERFRAAIGFGAATLMLLTAGYPYYAYYAIFLCAPYALLFLLPGFAPMPPAHGLSPGRGLVAIIFGGLGGLLICSPYLWKMGELLSQTVNRGGGDLLYATENSFSWVDTLGALTFPPAAQTEGWYYFGVFGLVLCAGYLVGAGRTGRQENDLRLRLGLVLWWLVLSYISYGAESALFRVLFDWMPGFSSLRYWGRMNIILLPIIAWVLALALQHWYAVSCQGDRTQKARWILALLACYAAIALLQRHLYKTPVLDPYWISLHQHLNPLIPGFVLTGLLAFLCLLLLSVLAYARGLRPATWLLLAIAGGLTVSFADIGTLGRQIWTVPEQRVDTHRTRLKLDQAARQSLSTPRIVQPFHATPSLDPTYRVGVIPDWYFKRYVDFLEEHVRRDKALVTLLGMREPARLFFSPGLNYSTPSEFLAAATPIPAAAVQFYDGDRLTLHWTTASSGYLSFIDNWDPDWRAVVDRTEVPIFRLFGTFKAIALPAGSHTLSFCYQPAPALRPCRSQEPQ